MDGFVAFDLNESLKLYLSDPATIPTPEADSNLQDCENDPDSFSAGLVNSVLNPAIEALAENPDALARGAIFDSFQFLLKCAPVSLDPLQRFPYDLDSELFRISRSTALLPTNCLSKLADVLISGLSAEVDVVSHELDTEEPEALQHHKRLLELYAFLLQWTVAALETKAAEKPTGAAPGRGRGAGKAAKAKSSAKDGTWDSAGQLQQALDVMCKTLRLKLVRMFVTTSECDTFVGLFTRPVYLIFESEQRTKNTAIRMHGFKVLGIAVKHHGHAFGAQTSIMQNLSYFEHLAEPMAEFLHILAEQYDYPQLTDEILREISTKEFNSNDTRGPKSVSTFIVRLSELVPRLVIKQMTMLAKQLDSEAYTLRCAVIEVCGNLIADLSKQEERSENHKTQINSFFDILVERFLDINPYCRSRVLQVLQKVCELEQKFPKRRQEVTELATRSLEDKSSNVRRNAIKLLAKLVSTHPFSAMHGGQLSLKDWTAWMQAVDAELDALKPPPDTPGLAEKKGAADETVDEALLDEATMMDGVEGASPQKLTEEQQREARERAEKEATTSEMVTRLQLTRKYYSEAIKFINVIHEATSVVCQLLSSKNKSEVIEAMDFFVMIDAYKIEASRTGVRRMLRLIWTKGNSDEGKGVQSHLIDCYKGLFFDAPGSFGENDAANYIARNMISLTFGATRAEMKSLEELLSTMVKSGMLSELVIEKLWQVYGYQKKDISKNQRRGAIAVLGMLATADPDIVIREMESLLRIGLGALGRADLELARYTCIALRRISPSGRQAREAFGRLPNDHAVLSRLASVAEAESDDKEWYGVAEQAIAAIYTLASQPDGLCTQILRRKIKAVFQRPSDRQASDGTPLTRGPTGLASPPPEHRPSGKPLVALAQLLFLVGHVAIKQIVHLEICEQEFKRKKAGREKEKAAGAKEGEAAPQDELDMIGGTTEDDFAEAMAQVREKELLYDGNALLSNFGPMVADICANNTRYDDPNLQASATLCMAKLMCVSSEYCEQNLPLLITILERSADPITRSNLVVALGDMAVCFNHLIDENTDFLYRRLKDDDASVKRTCLMTLTFLILAGQVKVKGQLGQMAKCLEDSDKRIASLSKMFFTELATKDNAVYNQFVDMFSVLCAEKDLDEDALRRIVKFLASFIEKDKHAKQLAEKLASRLPRCENERQWNDVAYALSLLQHKNEEINRMVSAGFRVVQAAA